MTLKPEGRIFMDTMVLAEMGNPIAKLNRLIKGGYTLVIPNTAVDVACFQRNPEWLRDQLQNGSIVIQMWMTPDEMVKKAFFWSSCQLSTQPADCFEDAIENLPNWDGIMMVKELMLRYGLSKEQWEPGQWAAPEPMNDEQKEILGVPDGATRTDILAACKFTGHMEIFDSYNAGYNRGLATQHHCGYLLNIDGELTDLQKK